ncbi:MAG: hypothetical protein GC200_05635 [Tepidisphaera sp.]|nr:hypothetical protein [Tepidisphaera sp.]
MNLSPLARGLALTLLAGAALVASPACQRYANYPAIPTSEGIPDDPNSNDTAKCVSLAVAYVATRYTPGGYNYDAKSAKEQGDTRVSFPIIVDAPRGLRRPFYQRICVDIGPGAEPLTPANEHSGTPVYHVRRAWLRQSRAIIDVMRPMYELPPNSQGQPIYQTVTVRLEGGGLEPWHVVHARGSEPGLDPIPSPYYLPEVDRIDQFDWQMEQDKKAAEPATPAATPESAPASTEPTPAQPSTEDEKPGS